MFGKCLTLCMLIIFGHSFVAAQSGAGFSSNPQSPDSAVAVTSGHYQPRSFLRRLFMGNNYRKEWEQPVKLPIFRLSQSGFTVKELGGGMQTKSLQLVDSQGKHWALRTVQKEITKGGLAPPLRTRLGQQLSQDIISAGFPYAAPLAGELAFAAGITAARPQAFFVADDAALGPHRTLFAGTVCTLEERDPGFDSTENSGALYWNLRRNDRYKVQAPVYLKARLLDILMADWDRHAGNWRWGLRDSAGFHFYYAIPRDRDWAFYDSKGWVPWIVQKTGAVRFFINFSQDLKHVKAQSWKCWTMDRMFLSEMDAAAWEAVINEFQASLSDVAIERAVRILPASIYSMDGAAFVQKLKSRRDALRKEVMKYYRFLSEEVLINGSDAEERFVVSSVGDELRVAIYRADTTKQKVYERRFLSTETYQLTLNGFGGDDIFEVAENVKSNIRIRINGGEGENSYRLNGKVRTTVASANATNGKEPTTNVRNNMTAAQTKQ